MNPMRLLLLSNSTMAGEPYLQWPAEAIRGFLGGGVRSVFFVPFAGIRITWDDYAAQVGERFEEWGYEVKPAHRSATPLREAARAEAVVVGGGNTFQLVALLQETGLLQVIRERAEDSVPYIGWSAGANVACPTLRTTNDMPVVQPGSFRTLGLVPFQINPHFTDAQPPGHAGETRTDRILEFVEVNPDVPVLGLPEGTGLRREGSSLELFGSGPGRLFVKGAQARDCPPGKPLDFLLGG
jgi:dipeptidase E